MPLPVRRDLLLSALALPLLDLTPTAVFAQLPDKGQTLGARGRERFDDGWRFAFGHLNDVDRDFGFGADLRTFAKQGPDAGDVSKPDVDDSKWRRLNLPHDWAVELPFVQNPKAGSYKPDEHGAVWDPAANHGFKPLGRDHPETSIGWYRKAFVTDTSDAGARVRLEFDGVFRSTVVIINGYIVKQHEGGYAPFAVDVTDFLATDGKPNIIAVRVDASLGEGWFYEGAGIYRHVWLVKHSPVHIPQYGVCLRPTEDGTVEVTTTVRNDSDTEVRIDLQSVIDAGLGGSGGPDLAGISSVASIRAWQEVEVVQHLKVASPHIWTLEAPYLYQIDVTVHDQSKGELDSLRTRFGFRQIRFDADSGFFLNGKSVKLKGTCNHQDHAGVGAAIPDAILRYRLQCLKDMGCNAVRTSHNPPAPEWLDLCDEMGILVVDETRMMTSSEQGLDDLRVMIRRDRNHPSVILWSIGNEEPQQGTARGAVIARTMKRVCLELDPTRGITAAMDSGFGNGITEVLDVIGFNYRDGKIDDFHKAFPKLPIIGTETASTVATRGEYVKDNKRHIVPAYDTEAPWWASTAEGWWPHFNAKPYTGGGFIWTGFDYRGEPTPYSEWPSISSQFGALDTCGFPKDNYYYYRAWWRPDPLLHLFPHWNWEGQEGKPVSVWVYSNCEEVELFVNGKSAGKKSMPKDGHLDWSIPYAAGKIEAFGSKAGKVILKDSRFTAGAAAKIILTANRSSLTADGRDCAVLRAEVVDAKGRSVPRASNLITFSVVSGGSIIGVGNGDPNSHESDKASQRAAFNGLCCAIAQADRKAGKFTIKVSADGLGSDVLTLKTL